MNLFFDSIILLYLIASVTLGPALWRDRRRVGTLESRYPKLTLTAVLLLCCSAVLVFWGSFIEPRRLVVRPVPIDLPHFEPTTPVRVALISDIHVGTYKKAGWLRRVSERIEQERPDLVLLAGDFIVNKPKHAQYLAAFADLASHIPTYAVLGDHDYHVELKPTFSIEEDTARTVRDTLTAAGVRVMENETQPIEQHGARFLLVGLDDWLAKKSKFPSLSDTSSLRDEPIIALVHNPDFILDPESKKADLIVGGNTHGGQIRLPVIGSVGKIPSALPDSFDKGLFNLENGTRLFITSGISESGPRARLFNPPEIVIISLF